MFLVQPGNGAVLSQLHRVSTIRIVLPNFACNVDKVESCSPSVALRATILTCPTFAALHGLSDNSFNVSFENLVAIWFVGSHLVDQGASPKDHVANLTR